MVDNTGFIGGIFIIAIFGLFIGIIVSNRKGYFKDINEGFDSTAPIGYILLGIMGIGLLILSIETIFPRRNNSR